MSKLIVKISMVFHRFQRKIEIISENLQLMFYKKKNREVLEELRLANMNLEFKAILDVARKLNILDRCDNKFSQAKDNTVSISYDTIKYFDKINDNSPRLIKKYYKRYIDLSNMNYTVEVLR